MVGAHGAAAPPRLRILFVGNSLTYWKPGLDAIFRGWNHDAASVVEGGATLQRLWDRGRAVTAIRSREYEYVVLQDDLPEYARECEAHFSKYARLFVEAARECGARPILLLTHSYERIRRTTLDTIARAHQSTARALDVVVAPSGLVLGHEGLAASTKLGTLLSRDKEHPLPTGMLLTALTVQAAIADSQGDAKAVETSQLEAMARAAIEAGALAGSVALAPPDALATMLASAVLSGRRWWKVYPDTPERTEM